ncbi:unnamed protein product [Ilex paraguariensis]|uniref:Transducin/WD40 repeat-like superfamily protein n=1 Tax=Ilex paraguariensis TaxID=185542 RepID=A0ABC8TAJ9_9AQUA
MEWATLQHLDLRHVGRSSKPLQPHAAAFHPTQALIAAAVGCHIIEFDTYTGSKISSIDIGSPVVRMSYSPINGHTVIAILEDCTIRSCDFDAEQTCVLHSPEKRMEQISTDTEVHLALTPLQPVVFFGFHRRMSVTVVGTVEGGKAPTKIKTDLKKPIVNLACHPRLPVLYVAYQDGLIRAYNINTYAVYYTLQLDNTIKLMGAGAFGFHPMLEWVFVGDRRGTLLAWDVSTERPLMIGITQVGSQPITSVAWLPMSHSLVTLSKDGTLQVWKTRVILNPNRPPMQANFFEPAAIESIDIPRILSQQGGEAVYPLPQIKALEVHPKLNLAALLFASMTGGDNRKNRAAYTREGRKQLFAVLQSARGSSASVLKEKLASLGSSGILADHQLQAQLQEHHLKGQSQLTISDIARKAFLYSDDILGISLRIFWLEFLGLHDMTSCTNAGENYEASLSLFVSIYWVQRRKTHRGPAGDTGCFSLTICNGCKQKVSDVVSIEFDVKVVSSLIAFNQMDSPPYFLVPDGEPLSLREYMCWLDDKTRPGGLRDRLVVCRKFSLGHSAKHFMEGHAKNAPISRLPLIAILDSKHHLKDTPVCEPFHLELNFFNKENRVLHYPVRAFYVDGVNLIAYSLSSGVENTYKKLYTSIPGNVEFHPKHMVYSKKQHLFLVVFEFSGMTNEVVFYWENTDSQLSNSKASMVKGRDAAFIGPKDNHFAILDEDKIGFSLYTLPGAAAQGADMKNGTLDQNQSEDMEVGSIKKPLQFMFDSEVDRIFSTPLDSTMMFASHGDQIGLAKLVQGYRVSASDGHYISTKAEGKKSIKLKVNEIVLKVHWQETLRGYVAGIITTQRVLIVSADLDILASSSTKFDRGLPSISSDAKT